MRLDVYAARTDAARTRANAAIKRIAAMPEFAALGDVLDKARHKEKDIEVLNEREAIAVALEAIAAHIEAQNKPQPEPVEEKPVPEK
jgi:hypothetical protein